MPPTTLLHTASVLFLILTILTILLRPVFVMTAQFTVAARSSTGTPSIGINGTEYKKGGTRDGSANNCTFDNEGDALAQTDVDKPLGILGKSNMCV
ncbi:hypothetical protein B0J12DRAFT_741621 [Macrophomina phaseolina]|uniref:Uncharacterized protein n=1 Tax=Macrophomina phaseolina TaxID=35725 RepID=A0ABQ8G6U3_9PEZI|nr:hypothetical protein B0J12DRAFT_741621 [Macrophomina phaseolina]